MSKNTKSGDSGDAGASNQIRQMVNFILQEAHEKANEIKIKTEHDFNLEKQMLVQAAKQRIQEEYLQKEKDWQIQERIRRSTIIGGARVKKMTARDELLKKLLAEAKERISNVAEGAQYADLLKQLIKQALIKIEEDEVVIVCREKDNATVKPTLSAASSEYVQLMQEQAHVDVTPKLSLQADNAHGLPPDSSGGILVTAAKGRIICDNTLDGRIQLVYHDLLPTIRAILFP